MAEGAVVTVVARDDDTFDVSPEEERALLEAMARADRGQVVGAFGWNPVAAAVTPIIVPVVFSVVDSLRQQAARYGWAG